MLDFATEIELYVRISETPVCYQRTYCLFNYYDFDRLNRMSDLGNPVSVRVISVEPPVRGFLHRPERASGDGLILTHGAGANCQSRLLTGLANALCESGLTVLRCDLPFRQLRPYGPPSPGSAERDQQGLKRAVEWMRQQVSGKIFLSGHSYGGRQASMLAAAEPGLVDGLLLLSYPLHPPKKPTQLRTGYFPFLQTPALFVSGSRDGFGTIEEMTRALELIPAKTKLIEVKGVGHELMPKKEDGSAIAMIVDEFGEMFR